MDAKHLETLRANLKRVMSDRGTNPRRLAIDAGLGQTAIRDLLQREHTEPKMGTLFKIAETLRVPVGELLGEPALTSRVEVAGSRALQDGDAVEIRQLDLSYSMGPGTNPDDFPEQTPVVFDLPFLQRITRAPSDSLFVARGNGDSMFPTLINDDQVLVDTSQRTVNMQDRIWAISVYGASMIKRLRLAAGGRVRIISDNAHVPPDEVPAEDLHVVGRVIWIGRQL